MKITILAIGTRGDVQPMVALGLRLQASGYEVRFAAPEEFESFVRQQELDYFPVRYDIKNMLKCEAGQALLESGTNATKAMINIGKVISPMLSQLGSDCYLACKGSDAVIHSWLGHYLGTSLFEKYKIPTFFAFLQPYHPNQAFPSFLSPIQSNLGSLLNRTTYLMQDMLRWLSFRTAVNQWRQQELDLPPVGISHLKDNPALRIPTLYGFSSHFIPKPANWGEHIEMTGYWFLDDSDWQPPKDLLDFLEAGPPPVCIGFGSMMTANPAATSDIVFKALDRTKQRGLYLTGWGGLELSASTDKIFQTQAIPHSWLFPRMAAVVHHGGCGTTGAGLQAGIPSILTPFAFDQPFWGQRIFEAGLGPKPILMKKLSVEGLAAAINTAVTDKGMQKRAADIGKCIQAEDGLGNAVAAIERFLK